MILDAMVTMTQTESTFRLLVLPVLAPLVAKMDGAGVHVAVLSCLLAWDASCEDCQLTKIENRWSAGRPCRSGGITLLSDPSFSR